MAAAIPIIEAIMAVASTAYSIASSSSANDKAAAAAAAAAQNQKLDQQQQQALAKNTNLDQLVAQAAGNNVTQQQQLQAKIAAGNAQAPGMSTEFWTGGDPNTNPNQTPGFAGLVNDVVNTQQGAA